MMVDDLINGDTWTHNSTIDELSYLKNVQVYVGSSGSSSLQNTTLCSGSKFLDLSRSNNYSNDYTCNMSYDLTSIHTSHTGEPYSVTDTYYP